MKESGYYPAGAEFDPRAPWNEVELPPKDVEVTISAIVSKTIKVPVRDYTIDEEGNIDFSECDLKKAVEENIRLPNINNDYSYYNCYSNYGHYGI